MNLTNDKIVEALQMQPLTEEDRANKHILGRLYGPIATSKESTRNGRKYNAELWERQLNDEIFNEKIKTKALFLELGHPLDREETDMSKVCACIPALPKTIDGDLYAYVDILDTPNGKILKTLCDYGFVPGISSRGSGDIMDNDEVDPETFFLETWDIVALPAVKKARLAVCEGLEAKQIKLNKALAESLNNATGKDKEIMVEALDNLNIKLNEEDLLPGGTPVDPADIPPALSEENELVEEAEDNADVEVVEDEVVEEPAEVEDTEVFTVKEFVDQFKDYDDEIAIEFKPISIDGVDYNINSVEVNDEQEGKLVIELGYDSPEKENDNIDEVEAAEEIAADEDVVEDEDKTTEEAIDNGFAEAMESLKECVRQKDLLEQKVKTLVNEKTVSDAEVEALKEELTKYKESFVRVSKIAVNAQNLEKEKKALTERLNQRETEIKTLKAQNTKATNITESMNAEAGKVKALTEQLKAANASNEEIREKLTEQAKQFKQEIAKRTNVAKAYKDKYNAILEKYVASKADMLGVRATEITNRLNENFTLEDIDTVCNELLTSASYSKLPFGLKRDVKVRIKESKENTTRKVVDPDNGYDIDDDLLILAGLKK